MIAKYPNTVEKTRKTNNIYFSISQKNINKKTDLAIQYKPNDIIFPLMG
jgi:hypothetical protein